MIPVGAFDPSAEFSFYPGDLTVSAGTVVTWTNQDTVVHSATSGTSDGSVGQPDGFFDSGLVDPGGTFEFTFTEPGTYAYFCTPHPWMQGTITVTG